MKTKQQHRTEETATPPVHVQNLLLRHEHRLSVVPAVAMEAMEMAKDADCSMSAFACLVERDAKLATEILSFANSTMFSNGHPVNSLHHALVRLGFRRCQNLIMSACAKELMSNVSMEQEWIRDILWRHSFTTATACLHINRAFGFGFQGEEFTAGLLHDFGRTLLAIASEDKFGEADSLSFIESPDLLEKEYSVFETNHCEFGAWYAESQNIPESLVAVMRLHHTPALANPHQKLIALVSAGDHIANHLQRFDEQFGYEPEENEAIVILGDLFQQNVAQNFLDIAPQLLTDIQVMSVAETSRCRSGGSNE